MLTVCAPPWTVPQEATGSRLMHCLSTSTTHERLISPSPCYEWSNVCRRQLIYALGSSGIAATKKAGTLWARLAVETLQQVLQLLQRVTALYSRGGSRHGHCRALQHYSALKLYSSTGSTLYSTLHPPSGFIVWAQALSDLVRRAESIEREGCLRSTSSCVVWA